MILTGKGENNFLKNIPKHSFLLTKPTLNRNYFSRVQSTGILSKPVTSLVVQWLRLHTSNVGGTGKFCMLYSAAPQKKKILTTTTKSVTDLGERKYPTPASSSPRREREIMPAP